MPNYGYIHKAVSDLSGGDSISNTILSAVALGDGRVHSSIKRSRLSKHDALRAIDNLVEDEMLIRIGSPAIAKKDELEISDKLYFISPFLRFWFAFISPYYKGIKESNYDEVKERFEKYKDEFINLIFEQLCEELLKMNLDERIEYIGNYWDNTTQIDILAQTRSRKTIVCACKYTNSKIKKSEFSKLQQKCEIANIKADAYVIFSKKGFSSELKSLKSDTLQLFTLKNFKELVNK